MAINKIQKNKISAKHLGHLGEAGIISPFTGEIQLSDSYLNYDFLYICSAYYSSGGARYGDILFPANNIVPSEFVSFSTENGFVRVLPHGNTWVKVVTNPGKYPVVVYGIKVNG